MALSDFIEEFQIFDKKLYVTICIYHIPRLGTSSPINKMIEEVIEELKSELPDYEEIQIAYVYETRGLMDVKEFQPLTEDSPVYYKEPCEIIVSHKLEHVFFMGMAMLEPIQERDDAPETRLYLITDEKFERVNQIVYRDENRIRMNPRFSGMYTKIILRKAPNAGGDILEEYIMNAQS